MVAMLSNGVVDADRGNSATLIKVDKLRELVGNKISLPQLVVVGDQSSGKSSVLEGITGFAFPRDAELCTRYATQITCRREDYESVTVTIIPHEDADLDTAARLKEFSRTMQKATQMDNQALAEIFKDVNVELGISSGRRKSGQPQSGNAFSQHLLKIEICSPVQEHFTVIDVPGIFRKETEGVTTESDISLVKNMVMSYMKDQRTIILAIVPANVDPATQEILKLAKSFDPEMKRTMGVLTKPDLAIEKAMQQIAIDHVSGKRNDLVLGYHIVKNRGSDHVDMTLEEGQQDEIAFFNKQPWAILKRTSRAGIGALKSRVRALLDDLVKSEFKKLRTEINNELASLSDKERAMGPPRSDANSQRAYLGGLCERFNGIVRDALGGNYTRHSKFFNEEPLRLITRVVELDEQYAAGMSKYGHTRAFSGDEAEPRFEPPPAQFRALESDLEPVSEEDRIKLFQRLKMLKKGGLLKASNSHSQASRRTLGQLFPIISKIESPDLSATDSMELSSGDEKTIMTYIRDVYINSRSADLGTFNGSLLATVFKEQTENWERITGAYIKLALHLVEGFIKSALHDVCPDSHVEEELYDNLLREHILARFARAEDHIKSLLNIERCNTPYTLNHYFNDNLNKIQSGRLIGSIKELAVEPRQDYYDPHIEAVSSPKRPGEYTLTEAQLEALGAHNQSNPEHTQEHIHDVLKSYYEVAMKRFVDNASMHVVHYDLLSAEDGPLNVFNITLIHSLSEDQLDQFAGESSLIKLEREKLDRDIKSFKAALQVLKGSAK